MAAPYAVRRAGSSNFDGIYWLGIILDLHPFYGPVGIKAALVTPKDGHADAARAALAMVTGAWKLGVRIFVGAGLRTSLSRSEANRWLKPKAEASPARMAQARAAHTHAWPGTESGSGFPRPR